MKLETFHKIFNLYQKERSLPQTSPLFSLRKFFNRQTHPGGWISQKLRKGNDSDWPAGRVKWNQSDDDNPTFDKPSPLESPLLARAQDPLPSQGWLCTQSSHRKEGGRTLNLKEGKTQNQQLEGKLVKSQPASWRQQKTQTCQMLQLPTEDPDLEGKVCMSTINVTIMCLNFCRATKIICLSLGAIARPRTKYFSASLSALSSLHLQVSWLPYSIILSTTIIRTLKHQPK